MFKKLIGLAAAALVTFGFVSTAIASDAELLH